MKFYFKSVISKNKGTLAFLAVMLLVRGAIANQYVVPTGSMQPTIAVGDHILVNRIAYDLKLPLTNIALAHLDEPKRGDIVVFQSPENGVTLVKRLIALPHDRVRVANGVVWINGEKVSHPESQLKLDSESIGYRENLGSHQFTVRRLPERIDTRDQEFTVPDRHYFMMGDNRDNSYDSRAWGFVPRELIIGRAGRVLYSVDFQKSAADIVAWDRAGQILN